MQFLIVVLFKSATRYELLCNNIQEVIAELRRLDEAEGYEDIQLITITKWED